MWLPGTEHRHASRRRIVTAPSQQKPALDRVFNLMSPCGENAWKMVAVVLFSPWAEPDRQTTVVSVASVTATDLGIGTLIGKESYPNNVSEVEPLSTHGSFMSVSLVSARGEAGSLADRCASSHL